MPSYYIDKRLCSCCLGAKRLGGEPCDHCSGSGHEPPPAPVVVQRTAFVTGLTPDPISPQLPNLGDPFPGEK